jgi:hypothetical protein
MPYSVDLYCTSTFDSRSAADLSGVQRHRARFRLHLLTSPLRQIPSLPHLHISSVPHPTSHTSSEPHPTSHCSLHHDISIPERSAERRAPFGRSANRPVGFRPHCGPPIHTRRAISPANRRSPAHDLPLARGNVNRVALRAHQGQRRAHRRDPLSVLRRREWHATPLSMPCAGSSVPRVVWRL